MDKAPKPIPMGINTLVKVDSRFDLFSVEASFINKKENFAFKPLI